MRALLARLERALPGVYWLFGTSFVASQLYALRWYLSVPRDAYPSLKLHPSEELPLLLHVSTAMAIIALLCSLFAAALLLLRRRFGTVVSGGAAGLLHVALLLPSLSGQSNLLQQYRAALLLLLTLCAIGAGSLLMKGLDHAAQRVTAGAGAIPRSRWQLHPRVLRWLLLLAALAGYAALHTATRPLRLYPALLLFLASTATLALGAALECGPLPGRLRRFHRVAIVTTACSLLFGVTSVAWVSHAQSFSRVRYIFSARTEAFKVAAALLPGASAQGRVKPQGFSAETLKTRPHVVLFVIDALRRDFVLGDKKDDNNAPHLLALAQRGRSYDQAYSASSGTAQSMVACLSGLPPLVLAQLEVVPPFLPTALAEAGYQTSAAWDLVTLRMDATFAMLQNRGLPDLGINAHFPPQADNVEARDQRQVEDALARLRGATGPRFEYLHLMATHGPFPGKEGRAKYRKAIRSADEQLGRFVQGLAAAGLTDEVLLLVFGDHGEGLGEHGRHGHNQTLYSEETHVPLVVVGRNVATAQISKPTSLMEVPQLVFEQLGTRWPYGDEGGRGAPHGRAGYVLQEYKMLDEVAYRTLRSPQRSFHQLHLLGQMELYAMPDDALEQSPLPLDAAEQEALTRLEREVEAWEEALIQQLEALPRYP
jgi:hypothetical protein